MVDRNPAEEGLAETCAHCGKPIGRVHGAERFRYPEEEQEEELRFCSDECARDYESHEDEELEENEIDRAGAT